MISIHFSKKSENSDRIFLSFFSVQVFAVLSDNFDYTQKKNAKKLLGGFF